MNKAVKILENSGRNDSEWLVRMASVQGLAELVSKLSGRIKELQKDLASDSSAAKRYELDSTTRLKTTAEETLNDVKNAETNEDLKKIYNVMN